jgi:hypothetical protein
MTITTREIAEKLWRYESMLEGMKAHYSVLYSISHSDTASEYFRATEREIADVQDMATALWEKKSIV